MDDSHDRLCDVLNESPVELINFGDNVHADTCSPALFEKYMLPAYQRRCEKLHAGGKFVFAHWDGNCKPLLPYAHETGLDGIAAITPLVKRASLPIAQAVPYGKTLSVFGALAASK